MILTLTRLLNAIWSFCFPRFCPGCSVEMTPYEDPCCLSCQSQLAFTHFEKYPINPVFQKMQLLLPVEYAATMIYWEDDAVIQKIIHQLKFGGQESLGSWLGSLLGQRLQKSPFKSCTAIVPLPLHVKKQKIRGYNQNQKVCEQLAEWLNIPLLENAVFRSKNTVQLSNHYHIDRFKEMKSAFQLNLDLDLKAPHWLLVDDVLTTGATLQSCGQALLQYPNAKLSIVTLASRM